MFVGCGGTAAAIRSLLRAQELREACQQFAPFMARLRARIVDLCDRSQFARAQQLAQLVSNNVRGPPAAPRSRADQRARTQVAGDAEVECHSVLAGGDWAAALQAALDLKLIIDVLTEQSFVIAVRMPRRAAVCPRSRVGAQDSAPRLAAMNALASVHVTLSQPKRCVAPAARAAARAALNRAAAPSRSSPRRSRSGPARCRGSPPTVRRRVRRRVAHLTRGRRPSLPPVPLLRDAAPQRGGAHQVRRRPATAMGGQAAISACPAARACRPPT